MILFSQLFENLEQANTANQKITYIVAYLKHANQQDKIWALALLYGKRPSKLMTSNELMEWAKEVSKLPEWLFNVSENSTKDVAELVALILPTSNSSSTISISKLMLEISEIKFLAKDKIKEKVMSFWKQFDSNEKYVFNKLIIGSFKMNVDHKNVLEALYEYCKIDKHLLAYNLQLTWNPFFTTFEELIYANADKIDSLKPYAFCLTKHFNGQMSSLGLSNEWQVEYSYMGLRAQLIIRNKQLYIWSNQFDMLTDKLPEFKNLQNSSVVNIVLDGILIPFKDGKQLPIQLLYSRLKRKSIPVKLLKDCPLVFMAFDVLEYNQEDLRVRKLKDRRQILEQIISTDLNSNIYLQENLKINNWSEIDALKVKARNASANGLVLKSILENYDQDQSNWLKLNLKSLHVLGVLLYVTQELNQTSFYTFAVRKGEGFVSFTKTNISLCDQDRIEIDAFIKENKLERFGPVRMVKPELVFEIEFENISFSKRHKSGVVLKSPRIKKWHKDKNISQINTLAELLEIVV